MKLIYGQKKAAKYLGCGHRTVARLIKRGEMPPPIQAEQYGSKVFRVWNTEDLDKIKPYLRNPSEIRPLLPPPENPL